MHGQPGYISNCDVYIKNMVTRQEHDSGVELFFFMSLLCTGNFKHNILTFGRFTISSLCLYTCTHMLENSGLCIHNYAIELAKPKSKQRNCLNGVLTKTIASIDDHSSYIRHKHCIDLLRGLSLRDFA